MISIESEASTMVAVTVSVQPPPSIAIPQETYPPRDTLPSMYDLPSEQPEDPGVPDEFHVIQPRLLRDTFQPVTYSEDSFFTAADINLYYDVHHTQWYKRPDWLAVLGISRRYDGHDMRLSYVVWQEQVIPYLIVELLSPGTEDEDLGETTRNRQDDEKRPPLKWVVYEQILRVPYYVTFNRYDDQVNYYKWLGGQYQAIQPDAQRLWLPEAGIGCGIWQGTYEGFTRKWLRFYGADGRWIQTPVEQAQRRVQHEKQRADRERQRAEQERQRAEQERQRAERLAAQLKALGLEPDET